MNLSDFKEMGESNVNDSMISASDVGQNQDKGNEFDEDKGNDLDEFKDMNSSNINDSMVSAPEVKEE